MDRVLKVIPVLMLVLVSVSGLMLTGCVSSTPTPPAPAPPAPTPAQGPQVDKLAPDFKLQSLDGQTVSLGDFRGKPVLLNFWATWCPPCRFEMPFIQEIYENKEWSGKGLVILAIDIGENPSVVKEFMESYDLSFTVLLDIDQDVALEYNIRAIPTTFFIDKDGIIQDIKVGAFSSKTEIERRLIKVIP
jgi:peroxiredoxin